MARCKHLCPVCLAKGRTVVLKLHYISFTTGVYKCTVPNCTYPLGDKVMFINKSILDSNSDDDSYSSDDIEAMIEDDLKELQDSTNANNFNNSTDVLSDSNDSIQEEENSVEGNLSVLNHEANNDFEDLFSALDQPKNTSHVSSPYTFTQEHTYSNLIAKLNDVNHSNKQEIVFINLQLNPSNIESDHFAQLFNPIDVKISDDSQDNNIIIDYPDNSIQDLNDSQPNVLASYEPSFKILGEITKENEKPETNKNIKRKQSVQTVETDEQYKKYDKKLPGTSKSTKQNLVVSDLEMDQPETAFKSLLTQRTLPNLKSNKKQTFPNAIMKHVSTLESVNKEIVKTDVKEKKTLLTDILTKTVLKKGKTEAQNFQGFSFGKNKTKSKICVKPKTNEPCEKDKNSVDDTLAELFANIDNLEAVNLPNDSYDISDVDDWINSICS